jgi:hypothetical protein
VQLSSKRDDVGLRARQIGDDVVGAPVRELQRVV